MDRQKQLQAAHAMSMASEYLMECLAIRGCKDVGIIIGVYDDNDSVVGGTADREDQPDILAKMARRQEIYNELNPHEKKGCAGWKIASLS
jgi:hypothetical protein